jgi:hypothetical protein
MYGGAVANASFLFFGLGMKVKNREKKIPTNVDCVI